MDVTTNELILLAISLFCVVWGFWKWNERKKLIISGIRVEGDVIELKSSMGTDGSATYNPVIKYVTLKQEVIIETYDIGANPPNYKIGDSVPIIYDNNNSKHFLIDDKLTRFVGPALICLGIIMIIGVVAHILFPQQTT